MGDEVVIAGIAAPLPDIHGLPDDITDITVRGLYVQPDDQTPCTGSVDFELSTTMSDPGSNTIIPPVKITQKLDRFGVVEVVLAATNNPNVDPTSGIVYKVTERIHGAPEPPRSYYIEVPRDSPQGVIDLADVAPALPGVPYYTYALESALLAHEADPLAHAPFLPTLAGTNTWTGTNIFDGNDTHNGVETYNGVTVFNGDVQFGSGEPWFDVKVYGALGDGSTDDTVAIQATIDAAGAGGVVFFPSATYKTTAAITTTHDNQTWLMHGATISVAHTGRGIVVGSATTRTQGVVIYGGSVRRSTGVDWFSASEGVRFWNTIYCAHHNFDIRGFESGHVLYGSNSKGQDYFTGMPRSILSCKFGIRLIADGASSWCNDNTYMGNGSISYSSSDPNAVNGYAIILGLVNSATSLNGNKFYSLSLENPGVSLGNPSYAVYNEGASNAFLGLRYEGFASPFIFESSNNTVGGNVYAYGDGLAGPSNVSQFVGRSTIEGTQGRYFGGGDGTNPLLTLRDINSITNTVLAVKSQDGLSTLTTIDALGTITAPKIQPKGSPWFDVKAYGALGDGTTDDTAAINAAITACSVGSTLFFPAATYLTTGLSLSKSLTILGYGATLSVTGSASVGISALADRVNVLGLKIAKSGSAGTSIGLAVGGTSTTSHWFRGRDLEITGFDTGVKTQFSFYGGYTNIDSHANITYNWRITNLANANTFENIHARGNQITQVGVRIDDSTANLTDCSFYGGTYEGNIVENFQILGADYITVVGGHFEANPPTALTGTVTLTNGATTMTGSGTSFSTALIAGQYIKLNADSSSAWVQISSITNNTTATLAEAYQGTGGSGAASLAGSNIRVANHTGTATGNKFISPNVSVSSSSAPGLYLAGSYTSLESAYVSLVVVISSAAVHPIQRVGNYAGGLIDLSNDTAMWGDATQSKFYLKNGTVKAFDVVAGGAQTNINRSDSNPFVFFVNGSEVGRMASTGIVTGSTWNGTHLIMGVWHIWIDSTGAPRIKNGVPLSDTDGTKVSAT